ncbi:MAG TPA: bifunctional diguanylate cyclase/phosphodiesterase, partial [Terriglobales bacterium]
LAGDAVLKAVAGRLASQVRNALPARFGGDEFAVLLEDIRLAEDAVRVADRLANRLGEPYSIEGRDVFVSISIGVAFGTPEVAGPSEIMRDADTALYRAKSNGRNRVEAFDESMRTELLTRLTMEADLHQALYAGQFEVHYQPKVNITDGVIEGFEALVRWRHPERGLIPPAQFIGVAEETGLISLIGQLVLNQACGHLGKWQNVQQHRPLHMAVNVSVKQLRDPVFPAQVEQAIRESGISPHSLCLEITEGVLMEHTESTIKTLSELKELGVRIQIDDFGTGYSSLAYLSRFPVDGLKIDRSFIHRVELPGRERAIIESIMALAQATGLEVVAEGIESEAQVQELRNLRCECGQGYYYSPPLSLVATEHLLAEADRLPAEQQPEPAGNLSSNQLPT